MPPVTIYASTQACPKLLNFILDLRQQGHQVRLRTLGQLPTPRAVRQASLRLEQAGLLQNRGTALLAVWGGVRVAALPLSNSSQQ